MWNWYMEQPNGSYEHPEARGRASQAGRVALALTEACQKRGQGRVGAPLSLVHSSLKQNSQVYVVAPFRDPSSSESNDEGLLDRLGRVPELVFVPQVWTKAEIGEWNATLLQTRWWNIGARSGWVEDSIPVLPFGFRLLLERHPRKHVTPANVHVIAALGENNMLTVRGVDYEATSVIDLLDKLEELYWKADGVVFLGTLLDELVACDAPA